MSLIQNDVKSHYVSRGTLIFLSIETYGSTAVNFYFQFFTLCKEDNKI